MRSWRLLLLCLAALVVAGAGALVLTRLPGPTPPEDTPSPPTEAPPQRLVPTPTGEHRWTPVPADPVPSVPVPTSPPTVPPALPTVELPWQVPPDDRWRFGAVDRLSDLVSYDVAALGLGWALTGVGDRPAPAGIELVYLVGVHGDTITDRTDGLAEFIRSRPGALWQVGNEPDVSWQANCTPEQYARVYGALYRLIKAADPSARVAAGAVSQPTPLRRRYLDAVLGAYRREYGDAMPVDVWTVHGALVREEPDQWGVGIPPGMDGQPGELLEVQDNDRLDLFQQHLADFRVWMRDRGYRDRPLVVTEFSILMPFSYGFYTPRVGAFMTGAFDWMLTATSPETGYPADGNRLVQRWAWYAIAAADYPTGNLFHPESHQMTPLGRIYADYLAGR